MEVKFMTKTKAAPKKQNKKAGMKPEGKQKKRCGLCGKAGRLMKTECCNQYICDDYDQYVLFSYARNSCARNHDRYTLCASHFNEGHKGDWRECKKCRDSFETEMYVWYGTNEYNFVKLENPPQYEPTLCANCKKIIRLAEDGYSVTGKGKYLCMRCSNLEFSKRLQKQ
jgi:hypothetical protein